MYDVSLNLRRNGELLRARRRYSETGNVEVGMMVAMRQTMTSNVSVCILVFVMGVSGRKAGLGKYMVAHTWFEKVRTMT